MGRKSKKQETVKPTTTTIKYSGEVTIKVKKGNKVLSSYKSHNEGKEKLFKFIAEALSGTFTKDNRPCRLVLFKQLNDSDTPAAPDFSINSSISSYIMYSTTPVPEAITSNNEVIGYSITYHFVIPSAYIQSGNTEIYKLAIYPETNSSESDICATFLFTNEAGTD